MILTLQQRKKVLGRLTTMTVEQLEDLKCRTVAMMDEAIACVRMKRDSVARQRWEREKDERS